MSGPSRLAGTWYIVEGITRYIESDGEVHEEHDLGGQDQRMLIREDGSIAFEYTMLGMYGRLDQLRHKGDQVDVTTEDVCYLEVIESEYTPDLTRVVLLARSPLYEPAVASFEVKPKSGSTIRYRMVVEHPDGSKTVSTLKLARSDRPLPALDETHVRREARGGPADYSWRHDYEEAEQQARQEKRQLFIFYKQWQDEACNRMLAEVFKQPEVGGLFQDTVNVLLDRDFGPKVPDYMAGYGVESVPASVMVSPEGAYRVWRGFIPPDQFVDFINEAKQQLAKP